MGVRKEHTLRQRHMKTEPKLKHKQTRRRSEHVGKRCTNSPSVYIVYSPEHREVILSPEAAPLADALVPLSNVPTVQVLSSLVSLVPVDNDDNDAL